MLALVGFVCVLLLVPGAFGLGDAYAKIVYNVSGLQNYTLHWNDRFPPDSQLMIYTETNGINHRRAVGVDYIFIIRDADGNVVDANVLSSRYRDYRDNDFVTFIEPINASWEDGSYIADIHIFDLLNDSIMDDYNNNVTRQLLNGSGIPDIPYMNRSDIINSTDLMATQYREIVQNFFVDKYAEKYPANRFVIQDFNLDSYNIPPGAPIKVSINISNTFYDNGNISMDLVVDNNTVANTTININAYTTKNFVITVPPDSTQLLDYGEHSLEIIPTSDHISGFNLSTTFNVSQGAIPIPARFVYENLQVDKLTAKPNDTVNVTVTLKNNGRTGTYPIDLIINDQLVQEKKITLNFSEQRKVNFSITEKDVGEYRVGLSNTNLSKIFFVESPEVTTTPQGGLGVQKESKIPSVLIVIGLSILVILIYIIRKRFIYKKIK
jgi:hypothetical protein